MGRGPGSGTSKSGSGARVANAQTKSGGAFRHRRFEISDEKSYLRLDDTFWNVLLSLVPMLVIAPMAATAMRAAIRPYSMAVAPFSF